MTALAKETCVPCKKGEGRLDAREAEGLLKTIDGWTFSNSPNGQSIEKSFNFKNFSEALAFVNRIGPVADEQGHHPDITFGWGYVIVVLTTHDVLGLSRNDFIVAAKIDELQAKA